MSTHTHWKASRANLQRNTLGLHCAFVLLRQACIWKCLLHKFSHKHSRIRRRRKKLNCLHPILRSMHFYPKFRSHIRLMIPFFYLFFNPQRLVEQLHVIHCPRAYGTYYNRKCKQPTNRINHTCYTNLQFLL